MIKIIVRGYELSILFYFAHKTLHTPPHTHTLLETDTQMSRSVTACCFLSFQYCNVQRSYFSIILISILCKYLNTKQTHMYTEIS